MESVNCTFEVKSNLDYEEFSIAMDNIRSVKELNKSILRRYQHSHDDEVYCYLFSYKGPSNKTIIEYLKRYIDEKKIDVNNILSQIPDGIYVLEKGFLFNNTGSVYIRDCDDYMQSVNPDDEAFRKFFLHVVNCMARLDYYFIDWNHYFSDPLVTNRP